MDTDGYSSTYIISYLEFDKHHKFLIATGHSLAVQIAIACLEDCADQVDDADLSFTKGQETFDLFEEERSLDELIFVELAHKS